MRMRTVKVNGGKRYPVRSVTKLQQEADGSVTRIVLSGQRRKRRVSRRWRRIERGLRRMSLAQQTAASDYLRRHSRSNRKKRNGAIRDFGKNFFRSQRKGRKKLKIRFL